jgi:hypothetical protein
MIIMALFCLMVSVAASVWTAAYAWTDAVPDLLWLDRVRRMDAWWDTIEAMHQTLETLRADEPGEGEELPARGGQYLAALRVGHAVEVAALGQVETVVLRAGEGRLAEAFAAERLGEIHADTLRRTA